MMKHAMLFLMFFLSLVTWADIQLKSIDYYTQDTYNTDTGTKVDLDFAVKSTVDSGDFFITVSGGSSGDVGNRQLSNGTDTAEYFLYTDAQNQISLKDLSANPTANEVLSGSFSFGVRRITVPYYYVVPKDSYPATGTYSDSVEVTLYSGTLSNYTEVSKVTIQFALQVQYEVNVSIVNTNEPFDINSTAVTLDFGILTRGLERSADVVVRANTPYKLSLTSSNGSVLRRTDQWEDSQIPYVCYVNGAAINLPAYQAQEIGQSTPTPAVGDRYSLNFIIGDFWDVMTGTFEDTLQISLQSM